MNLVEDTINTIISMLPLKNKRLISKKYHIALALSDLHNFKFPVHIHKQYSKIRKDKTFYLTNFSNKYNKIRVTVHPSLKSAPRKILAELMSDDRLRKDNYKQRFFQLREINEDDFREMVYGFTEVSSYIIEDKIC